MLFTMTKRQQFQADGMILDLKVVVSGMHSSQPIDEARGPITDPFVFVTSDAAKPVNVFRGDQGTLTFRVVLYYIFRETKSVLQKINSLPDELLIQAGGNRVYECSFDYTFPQDAAGPAGLVVEPPNKSQLSSDSEVDDDLTVELGAWNDRQGSPGGPKYIRINPFFNVPLNGKTKQLGFSFAAEGVGVAGGVGASRSAAARSSDTGIGTFTIPIHPQIITSKVIDAMATKLVDQVGHSFVGN